MRIIFEPEEGDKFERTEISNVVQFGICGSFLRQKIATAFFRRSMIADPNELIGLIEALKEDVGDFKRANTPK